MFLGERLSLRTISGRPSESIRAGLASNDVVGQGGDSGGERGRIEAATGASIDVSARFFDRSVDGQWGGLPSGLLLALGTKPVLAARSSVPGRRSRTGMSIHKKSSTICLRFSADEVLERFERLGALAG